ncbi:MAG TPA: hypothetical protein DCG75_13985 [Bacteroidales bacterium]|jgi:uncharacterized protein (DUF302 family)|nr:hypothetical protein [Bacteroidales bacterium]
MSYYINKTISTDFETAVQKVTEQLKSEGFGVLTEIDVKETLKKKIDVDFRKYKILGACNPPNAHQALLHEPYIGLMLPCNIVVQELDNGKIDVSAVDPQASMMAVQNPDLASTAQEIKVKLERVINSL